MKKILCALLIIVFVTIPMGAFASPFLTVEMDVNASGPNAAGWLGDYDVTSNPLGGITDVFCVENASMWGSPTTKYDFYHITDTEVASKYTQLAEATWYANWFVNSVGTDNDKVSAQLAIWNAMDMTTNTTFTGTGTSGTIDISTLINNYGLANDQSNFVSDWAVAVSPFSETIDWGVAGQNFLVQNPVPEPATMFLFGIGLLGLAGVSRKKQK